MKTAVSVRWIARIWSLASLAFIAAFAFGGGEGSNFPTATEIVALALFPVGVLAGMLVAWRYEAIGGATTLISLAAFYLWMETVGGRWPRGPYFVLLAAPGFLFLAAWLLERKRSRVIT
jgi:hypothetical protein